MFKWRRRRPKGSQVDRDLKEAAQALEDTEFGDFLGIYDRWSGASGPERDGGFAGETSPDPTGTGPDPSPDDDSK